MRAAVWRGARDGRVDTVEDLTIEEPTDAIIRVTTSGLCGSDLHPLRDPRAVHDGGRRARPRTDGHRRGGWSGRHGRRRR